MTMQRFLDYDAQLTTVLQSMVRLVEGFYPAFNITQAHLNKQERRVGFRLEVMAVLTVEDLLKIGQALGTTKINLRPRHESDEDASTEWTPMSGDDYLEVDCLEVTWEPDEDIGPWMAKPYKRDDPHYGERFVPPPITAEDIEAEKAIWEFLRTGKQPERGIIFSAKKKEPNQ